MFLGADGAAIPQAMAAHLAHIAALAGPERVGIGLDFMYLEGSDYNFYQVQQGAMAARLPRAAVGLHAARAALGSLVAALEGEGSAANEIRGILGGNYLKLAL